MKLLSLDLSTSTGWAYLEGHELKSYGRVTIHPKDFPMPYPMSYIACALAIADRLVNIAKQFQIEAVVIEETNKSSRFTSRFSQKLLEFIHFAVCMRLNEAFRMNPNYLSTSEWRKLSQTNLSQEDKEKNKEIKTQRDSQRIALVSKLKGSLIESYSRTMNGQGPAALKLLEKKASQEAKELASKEMNKVRAEIDGEVVGKVTEKHKSVERVNELYSLMFQLKDNDIAEAILLGRAYYIKTLPAKPNVKKRVGRMAGTTNSERGINGTDK